MQTLKENFAKTLMYKYQILQYHIILYSKYLSAHTCILKTPLYLKVINNFKIKFIFKKNERHNQGLA